MESSNRHHLRNSKESVFSNFVEFGREYLKSVCAEHDDSAWTKFLRWVMEKEGKSMDEQEINGKIMKSIVRDEEKKVDDDVCKWELTCCDIKMQDPCGPCCCDMYEEIVDPCPNGLLPRKKQTICGCDKRDTIKRKACCDQCRLQFERA